METTKNCSLKKPGQNDFYDVQDFDDNMETIDEHIGALESPVYEESKELEELKSGEPYLSAFGKIKKAVGALIAHIGDKDNPHGVTLAQLGAAAANSLAEHIQDKKNPHGVTKAQVGLGNCDNTADANKSVKYAASAGSADNAVKLNDRTDDQIISAARKYTRYHAVMNGLCTNAKDVNLATMYNETNKPQYVMRGQTEYLPNDMEIGFRYVEYFNADAARVVIDGWDGTGKPKQWFTCFINGSWCDWYSTPILNASLDLHLFGHNLMTTARVQGSDNKPLVLAAGDGNNSGTYVDLLGTYVYCRNTNATAWIPVYGASFTNPSSRLIKENIQDMSEEEAKKILDVRIVDFDYKEAFGGQKGQEGVIAEELLELFPHAVTVPEGYDETNFDESKGLENQIMSVDYAKLVSPLIKLVQMQQSQIDILQTRVSALEKGALK